MINLCDFPLFLRHMTTLEESSIDSSSGTRIPMIVSLFPAVNFDEVKDEYSAIHHIPQKPKSNDALMEDGRGNLVFVEFKNCKIDKPLQYELRKKIYDSLLIFSDITSETLSYTRTALKYCLVYNETENYNNLTDDELIEKNKAVQNSFSYDKIAKTFLDFANKEYICFGLKMFGGYCFKEVHTYTESEFTAYISSLENKRL